MKNNIFRKKILSKKMEIKKRINKLNNTNNIFKF